MSRIDTFRQMVIDANAGEKKRTYAFTSSHDTDHFVQMIADNNHVRKYERNYNVITVYFR